MNQVRMFSTGVLLLILGTTIPAFAQKGQEEKGGGGGKGQQSQHQQEPQRAQQPQAQHAQQAQHQQSQRAQQTQPQRTRQAQPQRAQQVRRQQQPQAVAYNGGNNGNHYGRISNANYSAHFGQGHSFRMMRPQMISGYNRFQYGGYWFGFNEGWPVGWNYNDDVYVEFIDGGYYMYNRRHPGIHLTLSLF